MDEIDSIGSTRLESGSGGKQASIKYLSYQLKVIEGLLPGHEMCSNKNRKDVTCALCIRSVCGTLGYRAPAISVARPALIWWSLTHFMATENLRVTLSCSNWLCKGMHGTRHDWYHQCILAFAVKSETMNLDQ